MEAFRNGGLFFIFTFLKKALAILLRKYDIQIVHNEQTFKFKIKNNDMKIQIKHNECSIDPSATYTEAQLENVITSLEAEYERELKKHFPEAEIEFLREDFSDAGIKVTQTGLEDPSEIENEVQTICEDVYETGNFWE